MRQRDWLWLGAWLGAIATYCAVAVISIVWSPGWGVWGAMIALNAVAVARLVVLLTGKDRHGSRRSRRGARHPGPAGSARYVAGPGPSGSPRRTRSASPRVDPIRAWKHAYVALTPKGWRFTGIGVGSSAYYGVDATAVCASDGGHVAPRANCSCGFYSLSERPAPVPRLAALEVDLYGHVVEHANGFRAERQRVLRVVCPASAFAAPCSHRTQIATDVTTFGSPWHSTQTHSVSCGKDATVTVDGAPLCAEHGLESGRRMRALDTDLSAIRDELQRDLPTEWEITS